MLAQTAYADGSPWELWLVNIDGSRFQQLTTLRLDSPVAAWSADGRSIAFYDPGGLNILNIRTGAVTNLDKHGAHSKGFDWWNPGH